MMGKVGERIVRSTKFQKSNLFRQPIISVVVQFANLMTFQRVNRYCPVVSQSKYFTHPVDRRFQFIRIFGSLKNFAREFFAQFLELFRLQRKNILTKVLGGSTQGFRISLITRDINFFRKLHRLTTIFSSGFG